MALTQFQINEFTKRAKAAGLDDATIQQEIAKKAQEFNGNSGGTIPQPTGGVSTAQQTLPGQQPPAGQPATQGDTSQQGDGFIASFINNLVQPAIDYGKFVGEAGYQASRYVFDPVFRKAINGEQLTPQEAAKLDPSKDTLFYSPEEAKKKLGDQAAIATTGAKATAGAMSYAIPFGKGAGIVSKVLLPGAVAGGLNEFSQNDNATVGSVVESGVTGAAAAGIVHGVGGMLSWAAGKSGDLIRQSEVLQEATRKIRVKASVYGAGIEKSINDTLDKYGFKGTAQQQYEKLQPVMDTIEGKIQQFITDNPNLAVSKEDIRKSFMDNLKSSLRTRDITSKQAVSEIEGYLNDLLVAAGDKGATTADPLLKAGAKDIPLATLREMKKVLNEDYGSVYKKIEAGTSLNSREKVIAAAWDSLDNAIKGVSPEVKSLLRDESNLYRAAQPLSSARANPPTFRVMGTSVPAGITQKLRDLGSTVLKKLGIGAEKLPQSGQLPQLMLEKLAAMTPALLKQQGLSDQEVQQVTEVTQGMAGGAQGQTPAGDINNPAAQATDQTQNAAVPQAMNPFGGLTKRQVLALALSNGAAAKDLEEVGKIYDMIGADQGTASKETQQVADSLRTEYFKRTQENQFIDAANAYDKVRSTSDTAAGDVSLIFAYMKMLDPNSVVREGEFATAQNAGGLPDMIVNQYNKVLNGQRLSPQQRQGFRNEATRVFQVYQQRQAPIDAYYQGLAKKYGIDPSLVGVGLYQGANQGQ